MRILNSSIIELYLLEMETVINMRLKFPGLELIYKSRLFELPVISFAVFLSFFLKPFTLPWINSSSFLIFFSLLPTPEIKRPSVFYSSPTVTLLCICQNPSTRERRKKILKLPDDDWNNTWEKIGSLQTIYIFCHPLTFFIVILFISPFQAMPH